MSAPREDPYPRHAAAVIALLGFAVFVIATVCALAQGCWLTAMLGGAVIVLVGDRVLAE